MYESFFHFHTSPFPAQPVVGNYFPTQAIESARQALVRIIERAEGPGLVVGPAGVGKTLLLRVLAEHFSDVFRIALLSGTRIDTRKALLQNILFEMGVPYRGMDEGELRLGLIDSLRPSDSCRNGILLLVDEAHTLPLRLLDEIRMITNVVRDGQPRARLVLAGGSAMEERFANPKLESFNQRIAARCYLQSLSREETFEFVRAQISWVGGDPDALFPEDAIRAVYQATDGIPRLINQVCDHALVMAQANDVRRLNAAHIQEAWADLQQLPPPWQPTASEEPAKNSTIIEFGELDKYESALSSPAIELDANMDECEFAVEEPSAPSVPLEEVQTTVICELPGADLAAEWVGGVDRVDEKTYEAFESRAHDPFADNFEEEEIVVDHVKAHEIEAFRGRTRVSCTEGLQIASHLEELTENPVSNDFVPLHENVQPVGTAVDIDFTTVETVNGNSGWLIDAPIKEESLVLTEADLDEEIECVPLPWTRGSLGDDRDLLIIDDDSAGFSVGPNDDTPHGKATRMEYRELFAQLRRAPQERSV
jgi:type II secretory pathway predicted ATPase ExeA